MLSEQHRTDATLECREATGSPGRLVGLLVPSGRIASDRPELIVGRGITTPSDGIALLPEHRSKTVVMKFDPIRGDDGELRVDHLLPNTPEGVASADQVIHLRQNADPTCPWRGRSGLAVAQSSGGLAATLVHALSAEGEVPSLRIIPQPFGQSQTAADSIRGAVSTGLRLALPETTASGGGAGRSSAPLTDWKSYTIQPEYMTGGVELHALALQETAGVCGLPSAMVPGADAAGPAVREAFRQFVALTVQPLGRILEAEVSRVLERPVRLQHHQLASADVASRARAYKALIENNIEQDRALELVGWT